MAMFFCGESGYKIGSVPGAIRIRRNVVAEMISRATRDPRRECCGLLAGRGVEIFAIFPAENVAENPATSYEIAPRDLFRILREIRAGEFELLGIYHSHPNGDNFPSARDIERAFYSGAAYFILSPRPDAANAVRAFSIRDAVVTELSVEIS